MHGQPMYGIYKEKRERKYVFGATDRFDEQVEKRGSIRTDRYLYIRNYMPGQSVYRPVKFRLDMPMMREMLELYANGSLNEAQSRWFRISSGTEELYDCEMDSYQIHNLADNPAYTEVLKKMRKAYHKEWIKPFNRDWEAEKEEFFVQRMWPEGKKPVCEPPKLCQEEGRLVVENDLSVYSALYRRKGEKRWSLYTAPVSITDGEKIEVKLERLGYTSSYDETKQN